MTLFTGSNTWYYISLVQCHKVTENQYGRTPNRTRVASHAVQCSGSLCRTGIPNGCKLTYICGPKGYLMLSNPSPRLGGLENLRPEGTWIGIPKGVSHWQSGRYRDLALHGRCIGGSIFLSAAGEFFSIWSPSRKIFHDNLASKHPQNSLKMLKTFKKNRKISKSATFRLGP